jgi:beta-galactosidase
MYKTLGWKNWIIAIAAAAVSFGCAARAADAPAPTPPPPPAFGADYQRMLNLLNLHGPAALPAMADDPGKTPGARLLPDGRHWADAAGNGVNRSAWGTWTNYDEAKANPYPLTDPLRFKSGEKVQDAVTWWQRRRPEIVRDFETEIYGKAPTPTPAVTWEVAKVDPAALGGTAIMKTVIGHIDNSAYPAAAPRIELTLWIPAHASGPVPMMVAVEGGPMPAGRRNAAPPPPPAQGPSAMLQVLALGWGYGTFAATTVQADNGAGLQSGIIGLVNRGQPRQPSDWGALAAWAWGLSRSIDYLQTDGAVDAKRLGVEGHSRWGKTALLAAASDPRWAICYASCSGEGGAKPSRRDWGETLDDVAGTGESHWMAGNFLKYARRWGELPVDSPELMALVAPRPLFVTGGTKDQWADPHGEFLAAVAAGPVYRLLGKKDLGTAAMPAPDAGLTGGDLAFRYHEGGHTDILDWPVFLKLAARYFGPASSASLAPDQPTAGGGAVWASRDFDFDWRFSLSGPAAAMLPKFDDSGWRRVNVPHDWSIEGPFSAEFGAGNGFAPGGIAWYRKHFRMDPTDEGKRVTLEMDGVYDHAEVWLNGFLVGGRPYGYESFTCELTPLLKFGDDENVLAVRVDHSRIGDSRWYTGAGIYRNVRLCVTDPLHIAHWGTYVTTPDLKENSATVRVETAIENQSGASQSFSLVSDLLDPDGHVLATASTPGALDQGGSRAMVQELTLARPQRWSPDSPALYILHSRLSVGARQVDEALTQFGVRTLEFNPDRGFFLNGVETKLKGVCIHQDGGSVGVAIPVQVWERRLRELKQLGVNAIRTSHNPPSPEFLDLCDRLGFLVMDEAFDEYTPGKNKWIVGHNIGTPGRFGYSESFAEWSVRDIQDMVRRDRNHPSIVMWSIGNEIDYPNDPFTDPVLGKGYRPGNPPGADLVKWGRPLAQAVRQLDPTRPVTAALASVLMSNTVGFAQILDVAGYNYQESRYAEDHAQYPKRVIYGSENSHSYDAWAAVRDNPMIGGQFLWTGIDYLGEANVWPDRANSAGLIDLCGFVKPLGRFRQSLWSSQPVVYLCASRSGQASRRNEGVGGNESWNWPDQAKLTVSCFTNCPDVALTLNGESFGAKHLDEAAKGVLRWEVPYAAGVIKATGLKDGRAVCEFALKTAGPASRVELHPYATQLRADGKDVCQVEFDVVDSQGLRVPDAAQELDFEISGPAQIIGLGNGDVTNMEPVKGPAFRAYEGRGLAIVQSSANPGSITLTVSAPGLQPATLALQSQ